MVSFNSRDVFNGRYFKKTTRFMIKPEVELDGRMIELEICEAVVENQPNDINALARLGHLYTEIGEYQKGLEADLKLTELCPQDTLVWYNRACSHALLLQTDEAFLALEKAVDLGYEDLEHMQTDSDLDSIRGEEEYRRILGKIIQKRSLLSDKK